VETTAPEAPRRDHLRTLLAGRNRLVPLERFFYLDYRGFYSRPDVHYAQAWAVVHFLRHGPRRWTALFADVLRHCEGDVTEAVATWRAWSDVDLEAMDQALEAHVRALWAGVDRR